MSALNERMREVIAAATHESDRYKTLESLTGINRTTWSNFMKGKQYASYEMIEAICRLWEQWTLYIVIGKGERPDIDPDRDTYAEVLPQDGGVVLKRDRKGRAVANIPHLLNCRAPYDPANFEWGYRGVGPYELSANILYLFGMPEQAAQKHAQAFCDEVVSSLPHQEAFISVERIKEWIEGRHVLAS
ncbi:DUF6166 domain-containing protein [Chromobacterium paludis]|uniref:Uncharacterized protein n=1 Tax=Chromobacterium paludis TaxID=2605945 RepID=A0A5C1DIC5_9NEIS|nr:DUF6166 domain-containing protein [Chromobacterium paludis]QEL56471.1 hypothetical protein FYK34_13320 [Chromobacterium paludis]